MAGRVQLPLQLDVSINGQAMDLIGGFTQISGDLASSPAELAELGIELPQEQRLQRLVRLKDIPRLAFRYDPARQTIDLRVTDERRRKHVVNAGGRGPNTIDRDAGAVLNYALVGTLNDDHLRDSRFDPWAGQGTLAAHLDGRVFTPSGAFEAAVLARAAHSPGDEDVIRLDTAWVTENPATLMRWRVGDAITGGLSWTRPVRIGGIQIQHSFELRPDLLTAPLPALDGTAAVPSTVDVYINNVKAISQAVPAGPFSITNLPVMTGTGQARVVVRDASGRETSTEKAFLSPSSMLAPGLYDYSLEAGFARRSYGTHSNDYDDAPVASATGRYGISERLTVEAHAEGGNGLANAGLGARTPIGSLAILSASLSASSYHDRQAAKATFGLEAHLGRVTIAAQSQRASRGYEELATVTSSETRREDRFDLISSMALRSIDIVSVGLPVAATGGHLNLAVVSVARDEGDRRHLATASYSQRLAGNISAHASGFHDSAGGRFGLFAGVSIALDGRRNLTIGASTDHKGASVTADYVKASDMTPGSVGWRTTVSRGSTERIGAQVNWTARMARVEASAVQAGDATHASLVVTGAIAAAGGGVFLANRIDDGFAVVDAGAPGVRVLHENREVGATGRDGRLLVTGLRANQENRIALDPLTLPLTMEVPQAQRSVVPASKSGVVVSMRGRQLETAAVVVLRDAKGILLPAGATGTHDATGETFVVGYDGETYLRSLGASNAVTVMVNGKPCTARFEYQRDRAAFGRIDGAICR